jgi:hypothetical protein
MQICYISYAVWVGIQTGMGNSENVVIRANNVAVQVDIAQNDQLKDTTSKPTVAGQVIALSIYI